MLPVVLAGGRGTRLWPLSTPSRPKPFLEVGGRSLLAAAVARLRPLGPPVVLTTRDLVPAVFAAVPGARVVAEPEPRGTGPAVALALALAEQAGTDGAIVAPSDHGVVDESAYRAAVGVAVREARSTGLPVVLGVPADRAESAFGWIVADGTAVKRFVEKPPPDEAEALRAAGARWNAGVFVVPVAAADVVDRRLGGAVGAARALLRGDPGPWSALETASFDRAVLEVEPARMVPCDCGWSDLGTFEALSATWPGVGFDNHVMAEEARTVDAQGCIVWAPGRKVELVGVTDVVVVDANGVLLVAARER